jgi:hypothetical protein
MIAETRPVALFSIIKIQQGGLVLFYQKHRVTETGATSVSKTSGNEHMVEISPMTFGSLKLDLWMCQHVLDDRLDSGNLPNDLRVTETAFGELLLVVGFTLTLLKWKSPQ